MGKLALLLADFFSNMLKYVVCPVRASQGQKGEQNFLSGSFKFQGTFMQILPTCNSITYCCYATQPALLNPI